MATYTEQQYAIDSWQKNFSKNSAETVTRGPTLTAMSLFQGDYIDVDYATRSSCVELRFPTPTLYPKKIIRSAIVKLYIQSRSYSGSGRLPEGSFVQWLINGNAQFLERAGINELLSALPSGGFIDMDVDAVDNNPYDPMLRMVREGAVHYSVCCGVTGGLYSNVRYTVQGSCTMHSHTGVNRPCVVYTYEDVIPSASDCYPATGFVNEKKPATFGWKFSYAVWNSYHVEPIDLRQASAKFRWRAKGARDYTEIPIEGEAQTITVPAGTFATDLIEWQVIVTSDDGVESAPAAWMELTTIDSLPVAEIVWPKSVYIDGAADNGFCWKHNIETGSPQSRYEAQYSTDGGLNWVALGDEATERQSLVVVANTLPAGAVLWRVRTYNSDDAAGEYSTPATVIVRSRPPKPSLSTLGDKPRPTVTWQAVGQQAFRVTAGEYDSGTVFGTAKSFKVPAYLPDGGAAVKVWVQNSFGLWSEPATANAAIRNLPGPPITLCVRPWQNQIAVSWSAAGYEKYYVLRDGVPVAKTVGVDWTDYTCIGKHTYQVMGVTADDYYGKSAAVTEILRVPDAALADVESFDWFPLRCRRDAYPGHGHTVARSVSYQHYDGRSLPVAQISGYEDAVHRLDYSLSPHGERGEHGEREEWEKLRALIGRTVVYKDRYERRFFGVLESVDAERDWASDISLTITEIDYREEVPYEI